MILKGEVPGEPSAGGYFSLEIQNKAAVPIGLLG